MKLSEYIQQLKDANSLRSKTLAELTNPNAILVMITKYNLTLETIKDLEKINQI